MRHEVKGVGLSRTWETLESEAPGPFRKYPHHGGQRPRLQPVLKHPQRGAVPNEHHPLPIALGGELRQETTHPLCDLHITLSVGKGGADCGPTCHFHFCTW